MQSSRFFHLENKIVISSLIIKMIGNWIYQLGIYVKDNIIGLISSIKSTTDKSVYALFV